MTLRATSSLAAIVLAAISVSASRSWAQCPDGSPPPSGRLENCAPRRAPDPNRIAVLPFRVTSVDSSLGEGFAELLAAEFTGEGSPRAVDMASVFGAWRRAGGGARKPLTRARSLQLARDLGAAYVSDGSIVGLGHQITVTATLINVADGIARGVSARVTASADSLDSALRQTATSLLASIGGQQRAIVGARYTDSPNAMREYLRGLAVWRRGRLREAAAAFDRAIAEDSSFTRAAFRRMIAEGWNVPGARPLGEQVWEQRSRLAPDERIVVEGLFGMDYPRERTPDEVVADLERLVKVLPDSPDALYFAGDFWFHSGSVIDPAHNLARAKTYFERAAAIDSQSTVLEHLLSTGVLLRDTALLRRVVPPLMRSDARGRWAASWIAAASIGDTAQLTLLRRRPQIEDPPSPWAFTMGVVANIPIAAINELYARWSAMVPAGPWQAVWQLRQGIVLAGRGRPAAAERIWNAPPGASGDFARVKLALADAGAGLDVAGSVERLARVTSGDAHAVGAAQCVVDVVRMRRGDSTTVDVVKYRGLAWEYCPWTLELLRIPKDTTASTIARLTRADSIIRTLDNAASGFETYLLARAWEAAGMPQRALAAIRYRIPDGFFSEAPWTLPEEGRLATIVGDTTAAIRAYKYYLEIMVDAEPVFAAKIDSVRAELAKLTRRIAP